MAPSPPTGSEAGTTRRPRTEARDDPWKFLPGLIASAVAATLMAVAWVACRFLVPKLEASWMDAGIRPSGIARVFLITSSLFVQYWWLVAVPLVAWAYLAHDPSPRRDDRPRG